MKIINLSKLIVILAALSIVGMTSGCGTGFDPLVSVGDPKVTPTLIFPLAANASLTSFQGFSTSHPSLEWNFSYSTNSNAVFAPAGGLVVATGATSVTLMHNARYTSLIENINTVAVRINDFVAEGTSLGSLNTTGSLKWTFYVDGVITCPASFLSVGARNTLTTTFVGTQLCGP